MKDIRAQLTDEEYAHLQKLLQPHEDFNGDCPYKKLYQLGLVNYGETGPGGMYQWHSLTDKGKALLNEFQQ